MSALRSILARLRALPAARVDALLGALVLAEGAAEVLLFARPAGAPVLLGLGTCVMTALAVGLRRLAPVTAVGLGFGARALTDLGGTELVDNIAGPYFATMLVAFTAGSVLSGRRLWLAGAVGVALSSLGTVLDEPHNTPSNFLFAAGLGVFGPMLLGQLLRSRTRLNEALREKAARLERQRDDEAEAAALEERTRIAGELQDVVAHALSAMTVQAGAARRLAERDPERARAAFAATEATGREALTELRRLLGVLRREDEELALAPQPSLAHVGALVRRSVAAGLPAELRLEGERRSLPAGIDLTAYRVVQEALLAARDVGHAGRAEVAVRFGADDVVVEVRDDGVRRGRRLLGMRERVAVYGGELTTGTGSDGGWRVAARLPLEAGA